MTHTFRAETACLTFTLRQVVVTVFATDMGLLVAAILLRGEALSSEIPLHIAIAALCATVLAIASNHWQRSKKESFEFEYFQMFREKIDLGYARPPMSLSLALSFTSCWIADTWYPLTALRDISPTNLF